jgi:uncharacterized protein (TIGR02058 family)
MNLKKFIVEMGMGIDQHGQDPTRAAQKAVKAAMVSNCLIGLLEVARLQDLNDMAVEVLIACPHPERVDPAQVLEAVPFGRKQIKIVTGGMIAHCLNRADLGDTSDETYVANAAITVSVDMDRVLAAWQTGYS